MELSERLRERAVKLLGELIRFDTTNPPGDELACARFLADWLNAGGLPARMLETMPGRGAAWAELEGDARPPLLLMGHLDVVPVGDRAAWSHDPFGGEVADGCVWGRGAVDCKGVLAAQAAALVEAASENDGGRPVRLLAAPDEEVGGAAGLGWIVENRPELVDCWCCLTEGGGEFYRIAGRGFSTFMVGEKGQLRLEITIRGRQGHAALPGDDQALWVLGEVLRRLRERPIAYRALEVNARLLELLLEGVEGGGRLLTGLRSGSSEAWTAFFELVRSGAAEFEPALRATYGDTLSPTILRAGEKINIIPGRAELSCDCRLLPGSDAEGFTAGISGLLEGLPVEVAVIESHPASVSAYDHPVVGIARELTARWEPGADFLPLLCLAGTDSRHLRWAGIDSYGFVPYPSEPLPADFTRRMHAVDERLEVEILAKLTQRYYELIREVRRR